MVNPFHYVRISKVVEFCLSNQADLYIACGWKRLLAVGIRLVEFRPIGDRQIDGRDLSLTGTKRVGNAGYLVLLSVLLSSSIIATRLTVFSGNLICPVKTVLLSLTLPLLFFVLALPLSLSFYLTSR